MLSMQQFEALLAKIGNLERRVEKLEADNERLKAKHWPKTSRK